MTAYAKTFSSTDSEILIIDMLSKAELSSAYLWPIEQGKDVSREIQF